MRKKFVWGFLFLWVLLSKPVNAQKIAPLNTATANITVVPVWIGCEGANCVGKTIDATAGGITLTSAQYNPTVSFTPSNLTQAQTATCANFGAKIWVSSAPAASLTLASGRGQPIQDGQGFSIYGFTAIANFRAIRDAAVSSTLVCDYYRQP